VRIAVAGPRPAVTGRTPGARGAPSLTVAREVPPCRQRRPTDATQDRGVVEPVARPRCRLVVGGLGVTGVTRRKRSTAPEPERDDVAFGIPVCTPGFRVDGDAAERDAEPVVERGFVGGPSLRGPAVGPIGIATVHGQYAVYPSVSR